MTVRLRLDELLQERGHTAYWLAKQTGIAHGVIYKLRHGKMTGIRFDYINRLCEALECEPGELFEIESNSGRRKKSIKAKK